MVKAAQSEFASSIADYLETHEKYEEMTKREAVIAAVLVLMHDAGAFAAFLKACGFDD